MWNKGKWKSCCRAIRVPG